MIELRTYDGPHPSTVEVSKHQRKDTALKALESRAGQRAALIVGDTVHWFERKRGSWSRKYTMVR